METPSGRLGDCTFPRETSHLDAGTALCQGLPSLAQQTFLEPLLGARAYARSCGQQGNANPREAHYQETAEAEAAAYIHKGENSGVSQGTGQDTHLLCVTLRICLMEAVPHGTPGMSKSIHFIVISKGIRVRMHWVRWSCSLAPLQVRWKLPDTCLKQVLVMCQIPGEALCVWPLT